MVRVKVKGSPYYAVNRGAVGKVVGRERIGTSSELLKVQFKDSTIWRFYPDELERLDGKAV